MKYKKGGSTIQPNTNNPTLSTNPTLNKSKYALFKSFLNDIKIFVKSNFIPVMLVSLFLIFYIFLWFRDPLTQEDIQGEIAKVTCSNGWSQDKCPNKYLAPDIECINNECDENTCCVNQINCSEWDGTCPNEFDKDTTKSCSPDIENDCSDNCCVKTCANFLNADCPTDFTKIATNFCSIPEGSNEYECNYMDCCAEHVTCATDFNPEDCPSNQIFISSPASVICDNNNCTAPRCCEDITGTVEEDTVTQQSEQQTQQQSEQPEQQGQSEQPEQPGQPEQPEQPGEEIITGDP